MALWISTAKASEILADVQLNPEIGASDSAFVTSVIQRAARFLVSQIHIDRYPEHSKGYSQSADGGSIDISSLSTNELLVSLDGDDYQTIELTLGGLTSGAAIATEIQAQIRAVDTGSYKYATCAFDATNTRYTIESPTYGEGSMVLVSFSTDYEDVAQALGFSPAFGGTEYTGGEGDPEYDDIVIALVTHWYNRVGVEGMKSFSIPGAGSYTEHDIDPSVLAFIKDNRRLVY